MSETIAEAESQPASWWEDVVDVYLSPTELFERRRDASWKRPALILAGLSVLLYLVLIPANAAVMQAAMAENPEAAEAMAQWRGLFHVIGAIFVPIMIAVLILYNGAIVWLGAKLLDAAMGFGRALLIATFAAYVMLPEQLAGGLMVLLRRGEPIDPETDLSVGVLQLIDAEALSPWTIALLAQIDVFSLWFAAIVAVGVHVVARATWTQAALVAAIVWLLGVVPALIGAAMGS